MAMESDAGLAGYFYCIDWPIEEVETAFSSPLGPLSPEPLLQPYIVIDPKTAYEFTPSEASSSSDVIDEEFEARLLDLEEPPYDHTNAPKLGDLYQADLAQAFAMMRAESVESERGKAGELLWRPDMLGERDMDAYLADTQCAEGEDVDEFFQPWRNREFEASGPAAEASPDVVDSKPRLVPQEEALSILHRAGYDVDRAKEEMKSRNIVWSAKKRDIEAWADTDLFKFETNMRLSKPFHDLPLQVPGKSVKDIIHFYYTWKKTPRYAVWRRRRAQGLAIRETPPVLLDAPTGVPLKEDEFAALRQFLGLRSRPRVDYSQSSSGGHIWRSAAAGVKRKQRADDDSSDTEDDKRKLPLTAYEIRIEPEVNLELLRLTKRRRLEEDGSFSIDLAVPLPSNEELLAEVAAQELAALEEARRLLLSEPLPDEPMPDAD